MSRLYACLNKYVFNLDLKVSSDGAYLIAFGSAFHLHGATYEKEPSPANTKIHFGDDQRTTVTIS